MAKVPVEVSFVGNQGDECVTGDEALWREVVDSHYMVTNDDVGFMSGVVEGMLEDVLRSNDEGLRFGDLLIAARQNEVIEILPGEEPWCLRAATDDDREMVRRCREESVRAARAEMSAANCPGGTFLGENEERVLVVKLHDKCTCSTEAWEDKSCGHPFCTVCGGHVHPISRVLVKGAQATVSCNRKSLRNIRFFFGKVSQDQKT